MLRNNWLSAVAVGILTVLALGCGSKYDTVPVKGKVTYDGQPVPALILQFKPAQGRASQGTTGPDGSFEMTYTIDQKGVMPGEHEITASWSPPSDDGSKPPEVVQKALDDFKAKGPVKATIDKPQEAYEIKLPR